MKDNQSKHFQERILTAPVMINLELTSGCNIRCRHCYNFWRDDSSTPKNRLDIDRMDKLIDMSIKDRIFHVVLTGGEPFLNFEVLEHALKRLHASSITTSVNSNLMLATKEKIERLKAVGLDHFLTSLNSYDPETNDYMADKRGSYEKIINGIKIAIENDIRVSVNMILSKVNRDHVYKTAKLCAELGVQCIFGTRLIPSAKVDNPEKTDFHLTRQGTINALNDLLKAKEDFGIGIGSLISYPLCLLGDLGKYKDFVGRGCPAQRGNRMVINANGETHACTHEMKSYGNVFDVGIKGAFKRMRKWHDGSYLSQECFECDYLNVCLSGCRSAAEVYSKDIAGKEPLFVGSRSIKVPYKISVPKGISEMIDAGKEFLVPEGIRFREEEGFYTINIRWANAFSINTELAEFLIQKQKNKGSVNLSNIPGNNSKRDLVNLIFKEALIPKDKNLKADFENRIKLGCSLNPEFIS